METLLAELSFEDPVGGTSHDGSFRRMTRWVGNGAQCYPSEAPSV
jgi:hypothetical protein